MNFENVINFLFFSGFQGKPSPKVCGKTPPFRWPAWYFGTAPFIKHRNLGNFPSL